VDVITLQRELQDRYPLQIHHIYCDKQELTVEFLPEHLKPLCLALRDEVAFRFDMLIDVAGVDYLHYGVTEWRTNETTTTGFDRGVNTAKPSASTTSSHPQRFASVYQLLSTQHRHRLRLRVFVPEKTMTIHFQHQTQHPMRCWMLWSKI